MKCYGEHLSSPSPGPAAPQLPSRLPGLTSRRHRASHPALHGADSRAGGGLCPSGVSFRCSGLLTAFPRQPGTSQGCPCSSVCSCRPWALGEAALRRGSRTGGAEASPTGVPAPPWRSSGRPQPPPQRRLPAEPPPAPPLCPRPPPLRRLGGGRSRFRRARGGWAAPELPGAGPAGHGRPVATAVCRGSPGPAGCPGPLAARPSAVASGGAAREDIWLPAHKHKQGAASEGLWGF